MKKAAVIDCQSQKTPSILEMVKHEGIEPEIINWKQANEFNYKTVQSIIISGGPYLFTESPTKHQELMAFFSFIDQINLPTLGICLGHQAIALSLGCTVYRGPERRTNDTIKIIEKHTLLEELPAEPEFAEDHCEGIIASSRIKVLASSQHYKIEAFAACDRPFLGVQFHPEVSGSNGQQLFHNFFKWADKVKK